ncbi:MAG TPA: glycosyltransferase family 2 protein [Candidatus Aquilonibacter sp.]|nr:glycosyltransferase family 2 protein [Candidatus Aquilonibacter sp.]
MVSAIIPARNEEVSVARTVESVAAQPEIGEVIVVDDQSTDRTGAILAQMAARIAKLRILSVGDLPRGWVGKNYAVSLGAAAATGEWLLFTDADTVHLPGSMRRALADAVDHDAVLVSYSPEQELGTFWEHALIPFIYCRLAARFSFARINDPHQPDAAANGQFLLVLRDAYQSVGGHAAVASEIVEDVALAQLVKRAGYRIYFAAPIGIVRTRMYQSFAAMWQGWTKNLYPLMGGRLRSMLLEFEAFPLSEMLALTLAWLLLARAQHISPWVLPAILLGALAGAHLRYAIALYRNLLPVSLVQYYVPGAVLYVAALVASWWRNTRGAVVWKGREYPAKSL